MARSAACGERLRQRQWTWRRLTPGRVGVGGLISANIVICMVGLSGAVPAPDPGGTAVTRITTAHAPDDHHRAHVPPPRVPGQTTVPTTTAPPPPPARG